MTHTPPPDISGVTAAAIRARHRSLSDKVLRTPSVPVVSPRLLDRLGQAEAWLKLECFQHSGTFKARGALSAVRALEPDALARGITAVSAGNHAIAAAWAARQAGVSARVVMQNTANPLRIRMARDLGAEVVLAEPGQPAFDAVERIRREEGRAFVHPFEGIDTTLGAAGVGLEMVEDMGGLDAVVVAVGGGGLMSGVASAVKLLAPATRVYGVEPEGAASVTRSLDEGRPVTLDRTDTIADSLAPPMALPFSLEVIRRHVDAMVTVSDEAIRGGMAALAEDCKLAVEPAAGAAMAAALGPLRDRLAGRRCAVLVCGANIDSPTHARLVTGGRD